MEKPKTKQYASEGAENPFNPDIENDPSTQERIQNFNARKRQVPVEVVSPEELKLNPKSEPLKGARLRAHPIWNKPRGSEKGN